MRFKGPIITFLLVVAAVSSPIARGRRGPVAQIGVILSPIARWHDPVTLESDNGVGGGAHFMVGYGISNTDLLGVGFDLNLRNSAVWPDSVGAQGLSSLRWDHYFSKQSGSLHSSLSVGRFWLNAPGGSPRSYGLGIQLGGGWEFRRNFDLMCMYTRATTEYRGAKLKNDILSVVVALKVYWLDD